VTERLARWQAGVLEAVAALETDRRQAEAHAAHLESPGAIAAYVDFFVDLFLHASADVRRISDELAAGARPDHVDALRGTAASAATEQRRSVTFRDKWINRPLPYDDVRPLLTHISTVSRDALTSFRDLAGAADALAQVLGAPPAPPAPGDAMDRRALFNKILGNRK
jgi:hypothetical protein